jgi:hypothetical protein
VCHTDDMEGAETEQGPTRMKSEAGGGKETTQFTKDTKREIGVSHDQLEVAGACARARGLAEIVHDVFV